MAQTLDSAGNVVTSGFSTNMSPSQFSSTQNTGGISPSQVTPVALPQVNPIANVNSLTSGITTPMQGSLNPSFVPPVQPTNLSLVQNSIDNQSPTTTDIQQTSAVNGLRDLLLGTSGNGSNGVTAQKAADTASLNQQYDLAGKQNAINSLSQQISANQTGAQASALGVDKFGGVNAQQYAAEGARYDREAAIKNLNLSAQLQAAQGNLTGAQNTINQAIAAKYAPQEAKIQALKDYLTINAPELARQDSKALAKQNALLDAAQQDLKDQKAKESATQNGIINIQTELAKNGKDPSIVSGATSVSQAIQMAGNNLATPNTEVIKLGDKSAYLIDKTTGKIVKSFGISENSTGSTIPANSVYSPVINTILGSGKFTKEQAIAIKTAINSGEDPATVIKNQAKNIMGQTEASKLTNFEVAKNTMTDLQGALNQYYANGGKTSLLKGTTEDVVAKLGNVEDPALRDLATQIASGLQIYRNAVSGTAYSVKEGAQIQAIFPGIDNSKGLNDAIISGRQKAFDSVIDGTYKSTIGEKAYSAMQQGSKPETIPKGIMDDRTFVEKAVTAQPIPYPQLVNNTPVGTIPVVDNKTGSIGYVPVAEYNASLYTKI